MRVTTIFNHILDLPKTTVSNVEISADNLTVIVKLRGKKLHCPKCDFVTNARYDTRPVRSYWRHLDIGKRKLELKSDLRRLKCPTHGVITEGVPFARANSRFSRDFEDLVGWLATTMDKTAVCRLVRIEWDSVGRIIERVMTTELDPKRLDGLFCIGIDEVSWKKGHSYITLVSDHASKKFVWGKEGKDSATLDTFFDELGKERSEAIGAISMDLGPAYESSAKKEGHATKAIICYDPFHVVQLGTGNAN